MKVIIFRGFSGEIFSTGMDILKQKIIEEMDNAEVSIHSYDEWDKAIKSIKKSDKSKIVLIGHSFGALACYKIADVLSNEEFPLIVSFDYSSFYSGLIDRSPNGIVPSNVKQAINFYQKVDPVIRGLELKRNDDSETMISNIETNHMHVQIDKAKDLHNTVLSTIKEI